MNLHDLQQLITTTLRACHRAPDAVRLLAVSKGQPAEHLITLYEQGIHCFAENHLQEALHKQQQLAHYPLEWHFIGPLQRNKTARIAAHFAWVHSLDRALIAQRLNDQRPSHCPPLQVCLQVNIDDEPQKAGVPVDELLALATFVQTLPRLTLRGLMCIPKPHVEEADQYASFLRLATLQDALNQTGHFTLDTLSMGMSDDFCAAIRAGSTLLRLGRILWT